MKKMIFMAFTVAISFSAFATNPAEPSDKILNSFRQDFPNVHQQLIRDCGNYYLVCFKEDEFTSCKVFYNLNGDILQTLKYYNASNLDPFIRAKVSKEFSGKDIYCITELTSKDDHYYEIKLQDNTSWYVVKYEMGRTILDKKLHKG